MDKWKADQQIQDQIPVLIANHHPHLTDISDKIIVIFKEKCSKKGDEKILGKTSKAPAILSVVSSDEINFIIELGHDQWLLLDAKQQTALLDHQLCFIGGEEDEKNCVMKYFLRQPDIYYFSEEVARNGNWRPLPSTETEDEENENEL
jgi:hypothetical protein